VSAAPYRPHQQLLALEIFGSRDRTGSQLVAVKIIDLEKTTDDIEDIQVLCRTGDGRVMLWAMFLTAAAGRDHGVEPVPQVMCAWFEAIAVCDCLAAII
jgi:hypothetical protein